MSSEIILNATKGYCRPCDQVVPAQIVVHDDAVWLRRNCPVHGATEARQTRHVDHYRRLERLLPPIQPNFSLDYEIAGAPHVRGVFVDLTGRCNLHCPNCLADAGGTSSDEANLDEFMAALAKLLPRRPVIVLSGGEPTLRADLAQWIARLTHAGYELKLLSNGIKLADPDYCRELVAAGLRWSLIQFDSFRDEGLLPLRGRPGLTDVRRRAVENMSSLGVNICLNCMLDTRHNLDEVGEVLRFAFRTPGIRHVQLMPARCLGRGEMAGEKYDLEDVDIIEAVASQTGNAIMYKDWLAFFRLMSSVYHLTGSPYFAPRRCFLPLPLVGDAERFFPITRWDSFLRQPGNLWPLIKMAARGGKAESANWSERSLVMVIESFREPASIDVGDASRCSRYYYRHGRLQQSCLYNVIDRPRMRAARECLC